MATQGKAKKAPAKKAPAKKAPAKKAVVTKAATTKAAAKKAPVTKAAVKKAPVKKAPVKKAPAKKAPATTTEIKPAPANWQLFDLSVDYGETTDVAARHPEVVKDLIARHDAWWKECRPLMVNEDVVGPAENPFKVMYRQQMGR